MLINLTLLGIITNYLIDFIFQRLQYIYLYIAYFICKILKLCRQKSGPKSQHKWKSRTKSPSLSTSHAQVQNLQTNTKDLGV